MKNIKEELIKLGKILNSSKKTRLLCISTTANKHNASIIFGSLRETKTTIAGSIILSDSRYIKTIIQYFDGLIEYFLIDTEIKNEMKDLEEKARKYIKKSEILFYKPNDFTTDSLDMFLACEIGSLKDKSVFIIGLGNIGSKTAIKLAERGADVTVYSLHSSKVKRIVSGINEFISANKKIRVVHNKYKGASGADIILGCTPGISVINKEIVELMKKRGIIIDVGNGTLTEDGIDCASDKNISVYCLSSMSGYVGMIENWLTTKELLQYRQRIKLNDHIHSVTPGFIGKKGDIIVDKINRPNKIIGICDGNGDILYGEDAKKILKKIIPTITNKKLIKIIKAKYF